MANDVSGNPWILDTPGSTSSLAWYGESYVENIEFENYAADTDTAVVKDAAGRIVASLNGAVDLSTVRTGKIGWVHGGLFLASITAGNVKVMIK